jgi:hypothetical protein
MQHTKSQIMKTQRIRAVGICFSGLLFVVAGCQTTHNSEPQAAVKAPDLPHPPAASAGDPPSALSYGMVTGLVKKRGNDAAGTH